MVLADIKGVFKEDYAYDIEKENWLRDCFSRIVFIILVVAKVTCTFSLSLCFLFFGFAYYRLKIFFS
jgi:hypothetical protein